jgi:diguanylate cyclase (GGDEF)-like protein
LDIAPQAKGGALAESICRVMRYDPEEARVQTAYRHRSGRLIPLRCSIRLLQKFPDSIFVAVGQSIGVPNCPEAQSLHTGSFDHLTLLPDRAWLWCQLEREVRRARQNDYRFAVLFADVDRFKDVNDSFGHLAGDQILKAVAHRLIASVRPDDDVVRFGGDEFVVLMKDVRSAEDVRRVARRISRNVSARGTHHRTKEWRARVTISVGVSISGGPLCCAVDAVDRADRAMYRAKALGRNGGTVMENSDMQLSRLQIAQNLAVGPDSSNELD